MDLFLRVTQPSRLDKTGKGCFGINFNFTFLFAKEKSQFFNIRPKHEKDRPFNLKYLNLRTYDKKNQIYLSLIFWQKLERKFLATSQEGGPATVMVILLVIGVSSPAVHRVQNSLAKTSHSIA